MDPREQNRMPYVAALDGIRAIAILAVLLFHVKPAALSGGFTGVDVFFVLSGFLITSIILHDIRAGCFSLKEFYLRRIQRLLPNVVVTVLAVLILWTVFMPPGMAVQTGGHGLWTLFDLSNIYIWRNLGGYWGDAAEGAPLTHTWSLGIEEQFYLFFPTTLLLLVRSQPNRIRFWLSAATVLSFGICLYGTYTYPDATFYLLPTRVWELLLGGILACYRKPIRLRQTQLEPFSFAARAYETIGWVGLGIIVVGYFFIGGTNRFPGFVALAPTTGTALVLLSVADGNTRISRLLSTSFMVRIGKLSYSLYLWHWPLIIFGKMQADVYGLPRWAGAAVGCLGGVLLGWGAYVGVERPLRQRGQGRFWRLMTIAAGFSLVAICCAVIRTKRTVFDPGHRFDTPAFYGKLFDATRPLKTAALIATTPRYADTYFPPLTNTEVDVWRTGGIVHLYGGGRPRIVVFGSSHALMYSRLIDDICREKGLSVAFLGADAGTPAFFETTANPNFTSLSEAREFDETRRRYLKEWHPDALFVIDRWDSRSGNLQGFEVKLRSFLQEVAPLTGRILFVAQVPVLKVGNEINLREYVNYLSGAEKRLPRLEPDSNEHFRNQVVAAAVAATADFPTLRILRADQLFYQKDGSVRYASGRTFFYADNNHLADKGTDVVRGLFQRAIGEAHGACSSP